LSERVTRAEQRGIHAILGNAMVRECLFATHTDV